MSRATFSQTILQHTNIVTRYFVTRYLVAPTALSHTTDVNQAFAQTNTNILSLFVPTGLQLSPSSFLLFTSSSFPPIRHLLDEVDIGVLQSFNFPIFIQFLIPKTYSREDHQGAFPREGCLV